MPTATVPSPVPLPTPRPNGSLLFSDSCSGGGAEALYDPGYMAFSVDGGQCRITANSGGYVLPAMYSYDAPADIIVEFDLNVIAPAPKSSYGVIFRSDDVPGGLDYYYQMCLDPADEKVEFSAWLYGDWVREEISSIAEPAASLGPSVRFRLEADGRQFRLFLNGLFAAEFVGDEISSPGLVGISISTMQEPEYFTFDNLVVYDIRQ